MQASGDQFGFTVGQRVEHQGYYGTVLFSGEVTGQSGVWIGVEWDDPSRGKHDGSHNGIRYFKTSHPTSGSLLRPCKLNCGVSCVEAIKTRYGKVEGSTAGVNEDSLLEMQKACNIPFVEMVGLDKVNTQQSQFEKLRVVQLENELVSGAGPPGQLGLLYPSIVELSLSHTLINSWKTVGSITVQLPQLTRLDVSGNKLSIPDDEESLNLMDAFKSVRHIVLSNLEYTWQDILACAKMWPCVTTLEAQSNKIYELESPCFGILSCLTTLHLQNNPIKDWMEVNKLGNIASLQILHLAETGLKEVFFPGEGESNLFPSLVELYLRHNEIDNWHSINELNKLKSLQSLHFLQNPLMDMPNSFEMIISRIKGLKRLNGSEISHDERRGAEYYYMKSFGSEWLRSCDEPALSKAFEHAHPRYLELIKKHGSFAEGEFATKPAPLKSRMLNLKIFCNNRPNMPQFQKKVPKNMTVQKLAGLVQKLFDTEGCLPSLCAVSPKAPDVQVLLEKDMQELSFYSIEDGDSIAVCW